MAEAFSASACFGARRSKHRNCQRPQHLAHGRCNPLRKTLTRACRNGRAFELRLCIRAGMACSLLSMNKVSAFVST